MIWINAERALRTKTGLGVLALVLIAAGYLLGAFTNTPVVAEPSLSAPRSRNVVVVYGPPDDAGVHTEIPAAAAPDEPGLELIPPPTDTFPKGTVVLK